jgi:hypothetical protein
MKDLAKIAVGTVVLLYGIYGYLSGEIYKIPGRHVPNDHLLVSGGGLIFCALSYVAFAFVLYIWAVPVRAEYKVKQRRKLKKYKRISMASLFFLGITLQAVGALLEI